MVSRIRRYRSISVASLKGVRSAAGVPLNFEVVDQSRAAQARSPKHDQRTRRDGI